MSDEQENLGPANSWHIRSVPDAVRQAFVDRAHAERISVADLLTRIVVGGNMVDTSLHPSTGDASPHASTTIDAARLKQLLECVDLLDRAELPRGVKGSVRALIGNELRAMRREQRRQGQLALPKASGE